MGRPKGTKIKHLIPFEPKTMEAIKAMAHKYNKTISGVIAGLVDFSDSAKFVTDENYAKRFNGILELCLINAELPPAGWNIPEDSDDFKKDFLAKKSVEILDAKVAELSAELAAKKAELAALKQEGD